MCLGVALHEASFLVHAFAEPAIVWFPFLGNKQTVRFPGGDQCGYIVESWPASIRSAPHQDTRASYHQAIGVAKSPALTIHPPRIRCSGQLSLGVFLSVPLIHVPLIHVSVPQRHPKEHRPSVVPRSRVHGWTLGSSRSLLSHAGLCCAATNPDRHHDQRHRQG
jgi:hypothetical protein